MQIELWELSRIRPYEKNPRLNDDAVAAVAASLKEFGFRQPLVVDADCVIIVGHTRFKAAKLLGLERVPVHMATDLTAAQIKAYRLADNQIATIAEWDFDLLPLELAGLQEMDFDLNLLGFDSEELAHLLDGDAAAKSACRTLEVRFADTPRCFPARNGGRRRPGAGCAAATHRAGEKCGLRRLGIRYGIFGDSPGVSDRLSGSPTVTERTGDSGSKGGKVGRLAVLTSVIRGEILSQPTNEPDEPVAGDSTAAGDSLGCVTQENLADVRR